jgi:tetratricopeptide (TPR) repeat protein
MTRTLIIGSTRYLKSRNGALHLVLTLALAMQLLPFSSSAQEPSSPRVRADTRKLDARATVTDELAPGETHTYLFTLEANQFARVVVQQRGVDVALSLRTDAGLLVATADDVESPNGSEALLVVTEAAGSFKLEVYADADAETRGQYSVRLAQVRAAAPQDHERVRAERLIAKGNGLLAQRTAQSRLGAIEQYKEAAAAFRRAGDRNREAGATNNIGLFYFWLGEIQAAFEHGERALSIWREIGDQRGEARALNLLGQVHASSGEAEKALDAHRRALEIRRALEDSLGVIASLDQIGMVYASFGDARRAVEYYEQALALAVKSGQRRREARLMANLGDAHETLGKR